MSRFPAQNFAAATERNDVRSNLASWYTPGLSDALGDRLIMSDNTSATSLELLRFKAEFSNASTFEPLLRQRVADVANLVHPGIGTVRGVEWLGVNEGLTLVSTQVVGRRLSEVLHDARGPQFAASLIRQLIPALAALEAHGAGVSHGLVTPERIVITPDGRLVLIEHVLGSVLADARLAAGRLAADFGLAVDHLDPEHRHGSVSDVSQVAHLAMLLLTGRRIEMQEAGVALRQAHAPLHVRGWLESALQLDGKGFASARAANDALSRWPAVESQNHLRRTLFVADSTTNEDDERWPAMTPPAGTHRGAMMVDFAEAKRSRPLAIGVDMPRTAEGQSATLFTEDQTLAPAASVEVDTGVRLTVRAWVTVALALLVIIEALVITGLLATWPQPAPTAAAPSAATVARPAPGRLDIPAKPAGAKIWVDGTLRGVSPITLSLPAGTYELTIGAAGRTTRQTVEITSGRSTVVSPR